MNRDDAARHPVEALSALIDGELDGDERSALESHLAACVGCRDLVDDLKTLGRAVANDAVPATPTDLAHRIAAALPDRASAAPSLPAIAPRSWFRAPMPIAAAASFVVATLVWLAWPAGGPVPDGARAARDEPAATGESTAVSPTANEAANPAAAPRAGERQDAGRPEAPPAPPSAPPPASVTILDKDKRAPAGSRSRRAMQSTAPEERDEAARLDQDPQTARGQEQLLEVQSAAQGRLEALNRSKAAPAQGITAPPTKGEEAKIGSEYIDAMPILGRNYQDALAQAPGVSDAQGRPTLPALRAEPYAVQLLPDDAMRVESAAYTCKIELSPEDARLLLAQYAAARPIAPPPASGVDKVAAGPPPAATRPAAGGDARGVAASSAVTDARVLTIEATPEGRALILRFVRERYRAAIEERCGPLPR